MSITVLFSVLFLIAAFVLMLVALGLVGNTHTAAQARLYDMLTEAEPEQVDIELVDTGHSRVARLVPMAQAAKIERSITLAGHPEGWDTGKVLAAKVWLALAGLGLGALFILKSPGLVTFIVLVGLPIMGYVVPSVLIDSRSRKRQEDIQDGLPDLLDQVSLSLDSGMSFEVALQRSGRVGTGPLSDEIVRTVQDIGLGVPRREAYRALAERNDVKDLKLFVRSVIQGEEYGVSMSDVVREQSSQMRLNRRMRAEAKANEIPVKMLIPLVLCILPTLFLMVLGPAIINAVAQFSSH
jgi:tight adherence protein C